MVSRLKSDEGSGALAYDGNPRCRGKVPYNMELMSVAYCSGVADVMNWSIFVVSNLWISGVFPLKSPFRTAQSVLATR